MKRLLIAMACLLLPVAAWSQEKEPFPASWSVEIGTGVYPFYMNFEPSRGLETELAQKGQEIYNISDALISSVTLAGGYRFSRRSEVIATAQLNWRNYQIRQYPVFGKDPAGKDRYDVIQKATYVDDGAAFVPAVTIRYRFLYNPDDLLTVYSGFGIGAVVSFSDNVSFGVIPDVTILGLRLGRDHFYVFAEATIGNVATLGYGGLGWKF